MMHPTGNHIPNNIKIWNRYLKLIDDKKNIIMAGILQLDNFTKFAYLIELIKI